MVTPGPASVVVVEFPFSDLSGSKLRRAVVLCDTGRGDWLLRQGTEGRAAVAQLWSVGRLLAFGRLKDFQLDAIG